MFPAQNATDNGAGRVLQTTPSDRVFVFYSDHGAPGILGMPAGPFLYADQLIKVLRERARHGAFKEMVLYVEACESGSIFEGAARCTLLRAAVPGAPLLLPPHASGHPVPCSRCARPTSGRGFKPA